MPELPQTHTSLFSWDTLSAIVQTTAVLLSVPAGVWLLTSYMKAR